METVIAYGAGKFAQTLLPILKTNFSVAFVMDNGLGNHNKRIADLEIVRPNQQNVNLFPVVILTSITGAFKSCVNTLRSLGCRQPIYGAVEYLGGMVVFRYDENYTIDDILQSCKFYLDQEAATFSIHCRQTALPYKEGKRRYFILSAADEAAFFSNTGGCAAGLRFLWDANNRLKLIDNLYVTCYGAAFVPQHSPGYENDTFKFNYNTDVYALHEEAQLASHTHLAQCLKIKKQSEYVRYLDAMFHFSPEDVFLFLDVYIADSFLQVFHDFPHVAIAHHYQGTVRSQEEKITPELGDFYDEMTIYLLKHIKEWIFPTRGAADGFLASANNEIRRLAQDCNFNVLYGSYEPKEQIAPDAEFMAELNRLQGFDVMFASAAFLYKNKGIERIPRILSLFKQSTGLKILWILIGMGEMEDEVRKAIEKYLEPSDYIWYNKRFENQDNVFALFERSDFYIMMHYISVSDLSTLQAMAYGCVPFLSNVGGNLEFCAFDNGILVDPQTTTLDLGKYFVNGKLDRNYLEKQKQRNQKIIWEKFTDKSFLRGYRDFLYAMGKSEDERI